MLTTRMLIFGGLFAGSIPASVGQLTGLERLDLSDNELTGETQISSLAHSGPMLSSFDLVYSRSTLSSLQLMLQLQLATLVHTDIIITGSIPESVGQLTQLTVLYLYNNKLSGKSRRPSACLHL